MIRSMRLHLSLSHVSSAIAKAKVKHGTRYARLLIQIIILHHFVLPFDRFFFLEPHSIVSPHQLGFRRGRSTLDKIAYPFQYFRIVYIPKSCSHTILATTNFSKAFDFGWHPTLFHIRLFLLAVSLALFDGLNLSFLPIALG